MKILYESKTVISPEGKRISFEENMSTEFIDMVTD